MVCAQTRLSYARSTNVSSLHNFFRREHPDRHPALGTRLQTSWLFRSSPASTKWTPALFLRRECNDSHPTRKPGPSRSPPGCPDGVSRSFCSIAWRKYGGSGVTLILSPQKPRWKLGRSIKGRWPPTNSYTRIPCCRSGFHLIYQALLLLLHHYQHHLLYSS